MAGADAIGAVAVSRAEVRKSVDRLESHLARGAKGGRGVRREINFLNALHRQTVRLSGVATGNPYTSAPSVFGQKAAEGLASGNTRTIGRVKSSILADFSSDGLQPARDWTLTGGGVWTWQANSSACPSCLSAHGGRNTGPFVPKHPSCLCIPIPNGEAQANGVTSLTPNTIGDQILAYGDPRYYKMARGLKSGTNSLGDAAAVENVNGQARGFRAWRDHMAKQEVTPVGTPTVPGAGGVVPTPAPIPTAVVAPPPAPAPTTAATKLPSIDSLTNKPVYKDPARRALIDDAFAKLDGLPKEARELYIRLLKEFDGDIVFRVATKSTRSIREMGKVSYRISRQTRQPIPGSQKLKLHLSRQSDEYDERVLRHNAHSKTVQRSGEKMRQWIADNPEPVQWRLATPDELFNTLVHELGHANEVSRALAGNHLVLPQNLVDEYWNMAYSGNANWRASLDGVKLIEYEYGLTNKPEMIAELYRFYLAGVPAGSVPGETIGVASKVLTAAEWRAKNPQLAQWVKENLV